MLLDVNNAENEQLAGNLDGCEADLEIDVLDELENEPYKRCGIRQKDQFSVTCG